LRFFGAFLPARRASDRPIAIACFAALDLFAAVTAAQRAALALMHCTFHLLRRAAGIFSSHDVSFGVGMNPYDWLAQS
jgi:hypothetical protein